MRHLGDGLFEATTPDASLKLPLSDGLSSGGWFEFLADIESVDPQALAPWISWVNGSAGSQLISCKSTDAGYYRALLDLPPNVSEWGFQPCVRDGRFRVRKLQVTELSDSEVALRMAWPTLRSKLLNPRLMWQLAAREVRAWRKLGWAGVRGSFDRLTRRPVNRGGYSQWCALHDTFVERDRERIEEHIEAMVDPPKFSVVMPVYDAEERWLRSAIDSVRRQLYPHWELCIADDCSTGQHVRRVLDESCRLDSRIRVVYRNRNGHISRASNSALELATGEFIALLDHDDELHPAALYMAAAAVQMDPQIDLLYSDEDKIDDAGRRVDPYFKSDWNPDLFLSHNLISHLGIYRTARVRELGGFRTGFEGSQDYDLALRFVERTPPERIRHLPFVLYHWRAIPGSVARDPEEKRYPHEAARRAIADSLRRRSVDAQVMPTPKNPWLHRVRYELPESPPSATLIIPTRDRRDLLERCVTSILERTDYPRYSLCVVDNGSSSGTSLEYLEQLERTQGIEVLRNDAPFNFSALNNMAVSRSGGEVLVFVNNDIEVIERGWLRELVSHAWRDEVGCVGSKLYYPDGRVQHAGVLLGPGGVAAHAHRMLPGDEPGYFGRAYLLQNFSAVTAACMAMRRSVFEEAGGFDEELRVAYNDIDLCLRVMQLGYRNVWTPYAELFHHESASRGSDLARKAYSRLREEHEIMRARWGPLLDNDPFYSPNLTLDAEDFSLAFPARARFPWSDAEPHGVRRTAEPMPERVRPSEVATSEAGPLRVRPRRARPSVGP